MTAQYTPYRDTVTVDNEEDNGDWGRHDHGFVQIYEKTVGDRMLPPRNLIFGGIALALFGGLLGILIGYFAHSNHSDCIPSLAVALHSVRDEDPTIRAKILKMVDVDKIKADVKEFSSLPHGAGSMRDSVLVEKIKSRWHAYGFDSVEVASYNVSLPRSSQNNTIFVKMEDGKNQLIYSAQKSVVISDAEQVEDVLPPPFSAFSANGNVLSNLVYVNKASLGDLQYLERRKINITGKIVLARQLDISPIEQVYNLYKYGVSGLILYPDPLDYNPPVLKMKPSPDSYWLPGDATVRQAAWWNGVGDPETVGYPSTVEAFKIPYKSEDSAEHMIPNIPVQPISYNQAYQLFSLLEGEDVPDDWKGGFNISYHIGAGKNTSGLNVQLEVHNKNSKKIISNVIGTIKGKVEPDRYIILGSQRDSTVFGAVDSASGTSVMMELTRVMGELLNKGWRPRRTLMFCSWGAEEFGWIGATEWIEENLKPLRERTVAYINVDDIVFGNSTLSVTASPLLYHAIFNATKEVPHPKDEEARRDDGLPNSVYYNWLHSHMDTRDVSSLLFPEFSASDFALVDYDETFLTEIDPHSKVTLVEVYKHSAMLKVRPGFESPTRRNSILPLVKKLGVPFIDMFFVHDPLISDLRYPLYRTEHDTYESLETFIDPKFEYHGAMARVIGELVRDLADSLFLPFNLLDVAQKLHDLSSLLKANMSKQESAEIDFNVLNSAIQNFTAAALNFHILQEKLDLADPMTIRRINDQLLLLERVFWNPISYHTKFIETDLLNHFNPKLQIVLLSAVKESLSYNSKAKDFHPDEMFEVMYNYLVFACLGSTAVLEGIV